MSHNLSLKVVFALEAIGSELLPSFALGFWDGSWVEQGCQHEYSSNHIAELNADAENETLELKIQKSNEELTLNILDLASSKTGESSLMLWPRETRTHRTLQL